MYRSFIKRLMDVLIVFLGLLILLPVLLGSAFGFTLLIRGRELSFFRNVRGRMENYLRLLN